MVDIIYRDNEIIVCIKPAGALSTDEEGGMPQLIRKELGDEDASVHTVHRLDRAVSGLMVFALSSESAAKLGKQIADRSFSKEYLAVVHGCPEESSGRFDDLLFRDSSKNMSYVVKRMRKGVKDASLEYSLLGSCEGLSLVKIRLLTGRTHQIRVQFSSRQMPLYADKKYGAASDPGEIALWSHSLAFSHPATGEKMEFSALPGKEKPWSLFPEYAGEREMKSVRTEHCPHWKECGACSHINEAYEASLEVRQARLEALLGDFCSVSPIIPMEDPYHYRGKVVTSLGTDKKGRTLSGLYEAESHRIVNVDSCPLEDRGCRELINYVLSMLPRYKLLPYDERSGKGFLRHIMARRSASTGQMMLILVAAEESFKAQKPFVKELREKFPDLASIYLNVNSRFTPVVLGKNYRLLSGREYIEDELLGFTFRLSPGAFYQVNTRQTEILYKTAIELADLKGEEKILDAYCGTGTIGICASKQAESVLGVELNGAAVKDAIANARANGVKNCFFKEADAGEFMKLCASKKEKLDLVFMDPPRSGSDSSFLQSLLKLSPEKIVYVSCCPETLARDLEILSKKYRVKKIQPVDMFPFTEHVESVALLRRQV